MNAGQYNVSFATTEQLHDSLNLASWHTYFCERRLVMVLPPLGHTLRCVLAIFQNNVPRDRSGPAQQKGVS